MKYFLFSFCISLTPHLTLFANVLFSRGFIKIKVYELEIKVAVFAEHPPSLLYSAMYAIAGLKF